MFKEQNECMHEKLTFGSGDFYIFCVDCNRSWVHRDLSNDSVSYEHSPLIFNNEYRVKFPNNLTFLECKYEENNKGK